MKMVALKIAVILAFVTAFLAVISRSYLLIPFPYLKEGEVQWVVMALALMLGASLMAMMPPVRPLEPADEPEWEFS